MFIIKILKNIKKHKEKYSLVFFFFPGHTYITEIDHVGQVKLAFQLIYNEYFSMSVLVYNHYFIPITYICWPLTLK